jgi:hypothetical protein
MSAFSKIPAFASAVILKVFYLLEFFLFLRLFLKFVGANQAAIVVEGLYNYSFPLVYPFYFMFEDIYWRGRLLEAATISAMIGYAIAAAVILGIIRFFSKDEIEKRWV